VAEKETELQLHSQEISSKKHLLMAVQAEAHTHIEHLSSELLTLRREVDSYENEEEREEQGQGDVTAYLEQIESLERKLSLREEELENQLAEYEERIGHY
jgi:chromosome segregation ATPase